MLILAMLSCKTTRDPGTGDDSPVADSDSATDDSTPPAGDPSALRFYGTGKSNVDRVRVDLDPGGESSTVDVGADDFTVELWLTGAAANNRAPAMDCSDAVWNRGNVLLDSTRMGSDGWGLSAAGGTLIFAVTVEGETGVICGGRDVLDEDWHHVAVARRASDGQLWLFSDGLVEAVAYGPTGDLSYPDGADPSAACGHAADEVCENDPYLVIGAEAHDSGPPFPSFSGTLDELRVSSTVRYTGAFEVPGRALSADDDTLALFHLDEAEGEVAEDELGGEPGELLIGGTPPGPEWVAESPFE